MASLKEDLLRFDRYAAENEATIPQKKEAIMRNAREEAMRMTQEAIKTRGKVREEELSRHTTMLARKKEDTIRNAKAEAERIRMQALKRQEEAVALIVQAVFKEAKV